MEFSSDVLRVARIPCFPFPFRTQTEEPAATESVWRRGEAQSVRSYDFNVWTTKKRVEKLRYMQRNPVK